MPMENSKTFTMYSLAAEMVMQQKPNRLIESALVAQGCTSSVAAEVTNQVYVRRRLMRELLDENVTQSGIKALLIDEGFPVEGADAVAVHIAQVRHDMNMPEWLLLLGIDRKLPTFVYFGLALLMLLSGGLGFAATYLGWNMPNGVTYLRAALAAMFGTGLTMLTSFIIRARNSRK